MQDSIVIVEAKGHAPGLTASLGTTKHGQQVSRQWIKRQATRLKEKGGEFARWGQELQEHIDAERIKVLVTKTEVDSVAKEVGQTAFELRNWADIGPDTFIP